MFSPHASVNTPVSHVTFLQVQSGECRQPGLQDRPQGLPESDHSMVQHLDGHRD